MNKKKLLFCLVAALSLPASAVLHAADAAPKAEAPQQQATAAPAYLGVVVGPVPQAVQAQLPEDIAPNQGLMVMRVMPGSPAEKAGLKPHDVLLAFDGKKLISPEDLISSVNNKKAGEQSRVEILRHGKVTGVDVTLAAQEGYQPGPRYSRDFPQLMPPPLPQRPDPQGEVFVQKSFQAMSVNRQPDGKYKAMIEFLDQDGNLKKYEYEGSGDELREQIKKEKDLPEAQKQQLLNALGGNTPDFPMRGFPAFPAFPDMEELQREFFTPPPWARPHRPGFWD
ncbi:S1C family serine protease [Thiolapillus sp.]